VGPVCPSRLKRESRIVIVVLVAAVVLGTSGLLLRTAAAGRVHSEARLSAGGIGKTRTEGGRLGSRAAGIHLRRAEPATGSAFVRGHLKFSLKDTLRPRFSLAQI